MENEAKKCPPELFLEWRHSMAQVELAEARAKLSQEKHHVLQLQIQLAQQGHALFKSVVKQGLDTLELKKKEYSAMVERLQAELGVSLGEYGIDEYTLELHKIEDNK